ncbi:nectin-4 isoform X3 [Salvelinus sp. IW2-2015]|uniref:nectin-4 isoform X3 n=1 Tax=Salvelinus sp. IW2-2015 TaxID=2691554 RepID=UPI000CDF5943|nr:nectin-4 isoform X3 [Salvelinus alpinus]
MFSQGIRVIGGSRTVVQGEDVDLSCRLLETDEELEQITWQKKTLEEPENHNFLLIYPNGVTDFISSNGLENRVQFFGNLTENIGSIRITAARLLDEGTFTCVFSVFPSGVYSIEIPLTVLVPPVMSVTVDVPPVVGENEVFLASCLAAGAKPQAEVRWNTDAFDSLVRTVTNSTQHANGTTTVVSHLLGVPTKAANQQQVQCVVNQSALATERTLAYTININYPPQTVNITLSEASPATVFLCVADSNPKAIYTWTRNLLFSTVCTSFLLYFYMDYYSTTYRTSTQACQFIHRHTHTTATRPLRLGFHPPRLTGLAGSQPHSGFTLSRTTLFGTYPSKDLPSAGTVLFGTYPSRIYPPQGPPCSGLTLNLRPVITQWAY